MNYKTMDYLSEGIIVAHIKTSKILYINKSARNFLKLELNINNDDINYFSQLISDNINKQDLEKKIIEDNKKYGKYEGIISLKSMSINNKNIPIEISCIIDDSNLYREDDYLVNYVFNITESKMMVYNNLSNIICDFYAEDNHASASVNFIISIVKLFKINKATSIIYNNNLEKFLKSFDYNLNGEFGDYSIELEKYFKDCINTLNHKIDDNIFNFLTIFKEKDYIYSENYFDIKDKLNEAGFTPINESEVKEIYLFVINQRNFFGYLVFERYNENKLSSSEIDLLTAFCNILNSNIEKHDLIQEYEDDILMKNIILENEKIPIAVIEKESFKILYHNDLYYNVLPNIEVGRICYELLGNTSKCQECCIDQDILVEDAANGDQKWIKKAFPFTLNSGLEAYMIYSKNNNDYVTQINALDELTEALLIRGFEEFYKNYLKISTYNYALCTIDIDKFKYVNDMFGYEIGDQILKKIANVISDFMEIGENFCRMNDDKFSIFLHYLEEEDLNLRIQDLSIRFNAMKEEHFQDIKITIMGGITLVNKDLSLNTLLDQATTARRSAKGSHANNFAFYNAEIDSKIKKEMQLEERIPYAIANDEFTAYLQPKFDLKTRKICGAEALVRWITPDGMIYPDQFIPLFERNGFILTLDFIVYEKVMIYIRKCMDNNLPVYPISLNVSRNHIKDENFMSKFKGLVKKYNIPLKYLELEITESVFVEDKKELLNFIDEIKGSLLKVSIDDFGTAYSSLQSLTDMDVDILKIDKGFLDNLDLSKNIVTKDEILIKNIINLAKELDFSVICEGVETNKQIELLKKVGCDYGQGYVFAKPMSIEEYEKQFL